MQLFGLFGCEILQPPRTADSKVLFPIARGKRGAFGDVAENGAVAIPPGISPDVIVWPNDTAY